MNKRAFAWFISLVLLCSSHLAFSKGRPPAPANFAASALSSTEIQLNWQSGGEDTGGYVLLIYRDFDQITSGPSNACDNGKDDGRRSRVLLDLVSSFTVTGLNPAETVGFYMCATGSDKDQKRSAVVRAVETTLPGPFEILYPSIVYLNVPNPKLTWSPSASATSYSVTIATDGACQNITASATNIAGTSYQVDRQADGIYFVCVAAHGKGGKIAHASNNGLNFIIDTTPPLLSAGPPLISNKAITPDASATDANPLTVLWTQVSGPGIITLDRPTFTTPNISASLEGVYEIQIVATDAAGNSSSSTTTVTWDTTPPGMTVGGDMIFAKATNLSTTAQDLTTIAYAWTQINGPGMLLFSSPNTSSSFVSASVDGVYSVRVSATDAAGNASSASIQITWDTTPPEIRVWPDAKTAKPVLIGATVTDLTTISYTWRQVSGPGNAVFSTTTQSSTTVSATADGTYGLQLTAQDSAGNVSSAITHLTWDFSLNVLEVGFSLPPQNGTEPVSVSVFNRPDPTPPNSPDQIPAWVEVQNLSNYVYRVDLSPTATADFVDRINAGDSIQDILRAVNHGVVTTIGADVALYVPDSALEQITLLDLTIDQTPSPVNLAASRISSLEKVIELGPDHIQFDTPLRLSFGFDRAKLAELGKTTDDLVIFSFDESSQKWQPIGTSVYEDGDRVEALISHFSLYAYGFRVPFVRPPSGLPDLSRYPGFTWPADADTPNDFLGKGASGTDEAVRRYEYPYSQAPDGCSTILGRESWGSVNLTPACDEHDRCYYTLGSDKYVCNRNYFNDISHQCYLGTRVRVVYDNPIKTTCDPIKWWQCKVTTETVESYIPRPFEQNLCVRTLAAGYAGAVTIAQGIVFAEAQIKQSHFEDWVRQLVTAPSCTTSGPPEALSLTVDSLHSASWLDYRKFPYFSVVDNGGVDWVRTTALFNVYGGSKFVPGTYTPRIRNAQTGATAVCPVVISDEIIPPIAPMYRFLATQGYFMDHFLTASFEEGSNAGFTYERIAFFFFTQPLVELASVPIYRCFNPHVGIGDHFISNNPNCEGYNVEGLYGWVSADAIPGVAEIPIYRCLQAQGFDHLTTNNPQECVVAGYAIEGGQGYVPQ